MSNPEPQVFVFSCPWCCYQIADLSGAAQLNYSPNIKINVVPCSGKVEIIDLLRTFENGADGVLVLGCLEDKCHHQNGSLTAKRRVGYLKGLLKDIGLGEERLEMSMLSPSTGPKLEEILDSMIKQIRKLGSSPLKGKSKT